MAAGKSRRKFIPPVNFKKYLLIIIVVYLDSALTHGYGEVCVAAMREPLLDWLTNLGYKIKSPDLSGSTGEQVDVVTFPGVYELIDGAFAFGAAVGSLYVIYFANQFGRKGGLIMTTFIGVCASIFCGYAKFFESASVLMLGRLLSGVKTGLNSALAPMYIIDLAPKGHRGQFGVMYGTFVSFGNLLGMVAGQTLGTKDYWPLTFSICVIPAIIQLIILPELPESPRYLYAMKGKQMECRKALKWFRENRYHEEELNDIRKEYLQRVALGKVTLKDILENVILRQALLLTSIMLMGQQLCGSSTIGVYMLLLLEKNTKKNTIRLLLLSSIFIILTFVGICSFFLIIVVTRRIVYFVSFTTMSIMCLMMSIIFAVPGIPDNHALFYGSVMLYSIAYKIGPGSLVWFIPSEFFITANAPIAYSIGLFLNWTTAYFMSIYFSSFSQYLGSYGFLNYVITNGFLAYFVYHRLPDTSYKTKRAIYREIYEIYKKNEF